MLVIRHRVNAIEQLSSLPPNVPVELIYMLLVRDCYPSRCDAGWPDLADWLAAAGRRFAILNIRKKGSKKLSLKWQKTAISKIFPS